MGANGGLPVTSGLWCPEPRSQHRHAAERKTPSCPCCALLMLLLIHRQDSQLSLLWLCSFASRYAAQVLLCNTLRCFTAITDVAYCLACLPISAAMDVPFLANTVPLMGNAKSDLTLPMMCILPMHANQLLAASMSFQLHAARVLVTDRRQ